VIEKKRMGWRYKKVANVTKISSGRIKMWKHRQDGSEFGLAFNNIQNKKEWELSVLEMWDG
jgi:hypothetical protein